MLGIWGDIITILGFIITLITFCFTLCIKKKMGKTLDKIRYSQKQNLYLGTLTEYYKKINRNDIQYAQILVILRDIYSLIEEIERYTIWVQSDMQQIRKFKDFTKSTLEEIDSYAKNHRSYNKYCIYCYSQFEKEHQQGIQETFITEKFRNDYCIALSNIISLIKQDSTLI